MTNRAIGCWGRRLCKPDLCIATFGEAMRWTLLCTMQSRSTQLIDHDDRMRAVVDGGADLVKGSLHRMGVAPGQNQPGALPLAGQMAPKMSPHR